MSFFIRLLEATDTNRREMEGIPAVQDMLHGKMSRASYEDFLLDLYHVVWHFCPIMATAASRCPDQFIDVRYHLYHNIEDEKGHENLVLDDLGAFDIAPATVRASQPSAAVQAMIAYNYHSAERIHPCCVLGMLYVLEIVSSVYGGQVAGAVAGGLGMELPKGFSFLDSHASMDVEHMARLRTLLQTIEDPAVQELVINAIQMNFYLFTQFLSTNRA
ncbi:pyrroloquinoline quinone (PQQ) biosynthesis protein C [Actimicrobium sp. GrIS 1.19]|jgi:pyrroloquinoline quinone (PQQ) biosynthesis protein C|uniref:TenA family transcriptional regulator n=1 Tax=Actimicrobium sp. GrIS 1.19 TaxID=3071708 RepID=UPI002DFE3DAC|nr:pyrroloquinoline quinone (PQQ) biosynthesis protein C [Actimicrobium sp. GrIS 1.19]